MYKDCPSKNVSINACSVIPPVDVQVITRAQTAKQTAEEGKQAEEDKATTSSIAPDEKPHTTKGEGSSKTKKRNQKRYAKAKVKGKQPESEPNEEEVREEETPSEEEQTTPLIPGQPLPPKLRAFPNPDEEKKRLETYSKMIREEQEMWEHIVA